MIDALRGTGRTVRQMLDAPQGAVFVSHHASACGYDIELAEKHGRPDLKIVAPGWLSGGAWRGRMFSGIVVDHDAYLSAGEQMYLRAVMTRVRKPK